MADHNRYDFFVFRVSLELGCFVTDYSCPRKDPNDYKPTTEAEFSKCVQELPPDYAFILYNFRYLGPGQQVEETIKNKTIFIYWKPTAGK